MAQGTSLSYLTDKMTALGASPKHIHRVYRAWLGLGSWEAKSDCRYPAALEKEIPAIRRELEGLSRVLPVQSAQAETVKLIVGLVCCCLGVRSASPLRWAAPSDAASA